LGQKGEQKIGRKALYVVEPVTLYIECSSQPVGGINQAVEDIALGFAIYRRELSPKRKIVLG
jgi:hypothetical protein